MPAIIAFGLISACYTNLAFTISVRRDRGVLKRVRGTPLPPVAYLAGIVGNALVSAVILTVLTIALGLTAYGVTLPHRYLGLVLTIAARRVLLQRVRRRGRDVHPERGRRARDRELRPVPAAVHLGNVRDRSRTRRCSGRIAAVFPIRHLVLQIDRGLRSVDHAAAGISAFHVGVLVAWGVAGSSIAATSLPVGAAAAVACDARTAR